MSCTAAYICYLRRDMCWSNIDVRGVTSVGECPEGLMHGPEGLATLPSNETSTHSMLEPSISQEGNFCRSLYH